MSRYGGPGPDAAAAVSPSGDRVTVTATVPGLSGGGLLLFSEKLECARATLLRSGTDIEILGPGNSAAR